MKNHPPVSFPWTARQWRTASVETILVSPAFKSFISRWHKADARSGAATLCYNEITRRAGLSENQPLDPDALGLMVRAAMEMVSDPSQPMEAVALFRLVTVIHSVISMAIVNMGPAVRRDFGETLDFLEGNSYRTAMMAIGEKLGCDLPGLSTTDLLPGAASQVPACGSPAPGGVFFGLN